MKKIAAILVLIAVGVTGVSADVVLTSRTEVINYGGEDYTVITIGAEETAGGTVVGFVGTDTAVGGEIMASNSVLNQVWYNNAIPTPDAEWLGFIAADSAIDTHFLYSDLVYVTVGSASPNEAQDGSYIRGGFAVKDETLLGSSLDFIQLVVAGNMPDLELVEGATEGELLYDFGITFAPAGSQSTEDSFFSGAIVPEPATMTLLAIGGLGALIRRKRR